MCGRPKAPVPKKRTCTSTPACWKTRSTKSFSTPTATSPIFTTKPLTRASFRRLSVSTCITMSAAKPGRRGSSTTKTSPPNPAAGRASRSLRLLNSARRVSPSKRCAPLKNQPLSRPFRSIRAATPSGSITKSTGTAATACSKSASPWPPPTARRATTSGSGLSSAAATPQNSTRCPPRCGRTSPTTAGSSAFPCSAIRAAAGISPTTTPCA
ncbi:MAG: hypothetical protein BWY37_02208 [Firmicutes bacterium ADurb.Bin262]|nr:MAG: hypothetical protein BWY37_02208 [Firmicutes bacterium ADurb.Bin262]